MAWGRRILDPPIFGTKLDFAVRFGNLRAESAKIRSAPQH
jgi:hypothetical protein